MSKDDYELRADSFKHVMDLHPARHGAFFTDWIDEDVPKGGAEEIAALRKALDEQRDRHNAEMQPFYRLQSALKRVLQEDEESKPADANTVSVAGLLQSQLALGKLLEDVNRRLALLEMGQTYAVNHQPFVAERNSKLGINPSPIVQAMACDTTASGEPIR